MTPLSWIIVGVAVVVIGIVVLVATRRVGGMPPVVDDRPGMDLPDTALGPDDLRGVRFAIVSRGYSMAQVDALIDRLIDQLGGVEFQPKGEFEAWLDDDQASAEAGQEPTPLADESTAPDQPPAEPAAPVAEPVVPVAEAVAAAVDPVPEPVPVAEAIAPVAEAVAPLAEHATVEHATAEHAAVVEHAVAEPVVPPAEHAAPATEVPPVALGEVFAPEVPPIFRPVAAQADTAELPAVEEKAAAVPPADEPSVLMGTGPVAVEPWADQAPAPAEAPARAAEHPARAAEQPAPMAEASTLIADGPFSASDVPPPPPPVEDVPPPPPPVEDVMPVPTLASMDNVEAGVPVVPQMPPPDPSMSPEDEITGDIRTPSVPEPPRPPEPPQPMAPPPPVAESVPEHTIGFEAQVAQLRAKAESLKTDDPIV